MQTMWQALKICLPITLMTFVIFTRSDLVTDPGWGQIADAFMVTVCTCGIAFAMFGKCFESWTADIPARLAIAASAAIGLFHPNDMLARYVGIALLPVVIWAIWRHGKIGARNAPPDMFEPVEPGKGDDLATIVAEAKREIG